MRLFFEKGRIYEGDELFGKFLGMQVNDGMLVDVLGMYPPGKMFLDRVKGLKRGVLVNAYVGYTLRGDLYEAEPFLIRGSADSLGVLFGYCMLLENGYFLCRFVLQYSMLVLMT